MPLKLMQKMDEVTLHSASEILAFFEAHPELSFEQMNEIVYTYAGQQFTAVVYVPHESYKGKRDLKRPKLELLEWLEKNGEALDSGEATHFFTSKFPKNSN